MTILYEETKFFRGGVTDCYPYTKSCRISAADYMLARYHTTSDSPCRMCKKIVKGQHRVKTPAKGYMTHLRRFSISISFSGLHEAPRVHSDGVAPREDAGRVLVISIRLRVRRRSRFMRSA